MKKVRTFLKDSGRVLSVVALIIFTFCFAMFQGGFVSWFIFFTVIPFLIYSVLLSLVPLRFSQIEREVLPTHLKRGDDLLITVRFRNKTFFPLIFMTVREISHFEKQSEHGKLFFVGIKREFEWTYVIEDLQRGEYQFKGLEFIVTDFFGWTIRQKQVRAPQVFLVYPKTTDLAFSSMHMQYDQGAALSKYSIVKDTTMATGVRDYQPGDRFSWIHWKSFAKNSTLRTKEFEDRQSQQIFVCLQQNSSKLFEEAVDLTASIMKIIVKNRVDVSFATAGENRLNMPFVRTESQLEKVMQHLAVVEANGENTAATLLRGDQKELSRSVLVIVTGELTKDCKEVLMDSAKYTRAVICFVVVTKEQLKTIDAPQRTIGQSRVVYLTEDMFSQAFTEVNKP
ncbi:DUF58 domain-containing protein [Solibacillus sp. CAU 1738]|uniref:DUF58 domain-containing protein n=1 Tax=Solibacillus sp. CAU 1738 TaxID=3140363 RepID=UPI003261CE84